MSGIKRTHADARLSEWVRFRDGMRCMRCASMPASSGLHAAHMFSRRCGVCTKDWHKPHYCTRLDPDNLLALCYGCHSHLDSHPHEKEAFWRSVIGRKAFDALTLRAHGYIAPQFLRRFDVSDWGMELRLMRGEVIAGTTPS